MILKNFFNDDGSDVFKSYLLSGATFESDLEIPIIKSIKTIPDNLISFSNAKHSKAFNSWVHFYMDDSKFEQLWNNPKRYLPMFKSFAGVISPDFSLYVDMPLTQQIWNTFRNRAIGCWLNSNGIPFIPNVRFSDARSFDFCCLGIEKGSTIAIGTLGCIKSSKERDIFKFGLDYVLRTIEPYTVVIYGNMPDDIFSRYIDLGIHFIHFDSDISVAHRKVGR